MRTTQRRVVYGRGGTGPNNKMFGKGDRTKTATPESAGPQTAGITSQKSKRNPKFPEGGAMPRSGGLASPAKSGETAPPGATARSSTRNYSKGGESRPARPGECGT